MMFAPVAKIAKSLKRTPAATQQKEIRGDNSLPSAEAIVRACLNVVFLDVGACRAAAILCRPHRTKRLFAALLTRAL
jgi:hypothetical protein